MTRKNPIRSNLSLAYAFWIASLLFGFPLISSFYAVWQSTTAFVSVVIPYTVISVLVGLLILRMGNKKEEEECHIAKDVHAMGDDENTVTKRSMMWSSNAPVVALALGTVAVIS